MTSRIVSLPGAHHPAAASAEVADLPGRDASSGPRATSNVLPAAPRHAEETGLPLLLLTELLLKVMHQHGLQTLHELAVHLKLGPALVEELCAMLRKDTLVEVRRRGELDGDVTYEMTQAGRARAGEALARNQYSGPAPVPIAVYAQRVREQSVARMGVTRAELHRALADVVMRPEVGDQLGAAMNSHRAILLYGPSGSGKTFLCQQMARLLSGQVAVPHAIEGRRRDRPHLRSAGASPGGGGERAPPDARQPASCGRSVGALRAPGRRHRRRADPGDARPRLRSARRLLPGARRTSRRTTAFSSSTTSVARS
jgi:DNA-binding PadR family transcriptional regulator